MKIKLSTTLKWPLHRQIPKAWEASGISVVVNCEVEECDAWVVYQGLHRPETTIAPPSRTFFFGYEPPGLHAYNPRFLSQFAKVITCQSVKHPNLIRRHQAQPWLAGVSRQGKANIHRSECYRFSYDDFAAMSMPTKTSMLSAICSTKQIVPGHSARLAFVQTVKQSLLERFSLYGYGFQPLEDKWDALEKYHYHLVLENSSVADYWSEKLADAYLAWTLPIVWGCPNLADYFPPESFILLDPSDPENATRKITQVISEPPTKTQLLAVNEARQLVLTKYNLFAEILRLCELSKPNTPEKITIRDERLFLPGGWTRPAIRFLTDRWR